MNFQRTIRALMSGTTFAGDEGGAQGRMDKAKLTGVTEVDYRKFFGDACIGSSHGSIILHRDTINITVGGHDGPVTSLPEYLASSSILPGIKVDAGMATIGGQRFVGAITELPERLKQASACGAKFTKFRFAYGPDTPTYVLEHGAIQLALYCKASLEHGLIPYPEPELERSLLKAEHDDNVLEITGKMLGLLMTALSKYEVSLSDIILKTNLLEYSTPQTPDEIAEQTFDLLRPWMEQAGGVKLLSGGQTAEEAFSRTAALTKLVNAHTWRSVRDYPRLSTSFSRAAMHGVLECWRDHGRDAALKLFREISVQNANALKF